MKTFPALYIDPQGVIRYNLFPHTNGVWTDDFSYEHKVQAAKDSAIELLDQKQAKKLLFEQFCIFPAEYKDGVEYIRPLPSGWGVKVREVLDPVSSGASPFGSVSNDKKVAVLIPPPTSEQITIDRLGNTAEPVMGQKEESQEEIFDDLFSQYFKMLHERNSWSYTGEVLREKFTITRRKP